MKRIVLLAVVLALGGAAALWLAPRGDRVEQRLLRSGGRLVQMAAQRPSRTAKIFAAVVAIAWGGVAAGLLWQRAKQSPPRLEPPRTPLSRSDGDAPPPTECPAKSGRHS
jgi:hypothetical protein